MLSFQDRKTDVSRGNSVSLYKNYSELPGGSFTVVSPLTAMQKMMSMSEEMTHEGENTKCVLKTWEILEGMPGARSKSMPFHSQSTHVNVCNKSMSC